MRKPLLNISLLLVAMSGFAQVPPTPTPPMTRQDSIFADSIAMTNELEQVVVIGYGTRRAGAITGSVSQVKAADIVRTPAQSAIQAIQGKAAGVNIVTNDEPGASPTIRVRGLGTITGARDPLYVIDGIETSTAAGINPSDIATIDVLKDASSLAIYGQKGSNGVVIITTKKGRKGQMKVSYDAFYGQKTIQRKVEMADSYRFAYYNNSALGSTSYYSFQQPYNTDWLDEITQTGEVISHTVALSGGGDTGTYYFSASNYREKGILEGTDFQRTNILLKNDLLLINDRLKVTPFVNLSLTKGVGKPLSAFTNAYMQSPIVPVRFPDGTWGAPIRNAAGIADPAGADRFNNVANPVAQLYYANGEYKNTKLIGSINAELKVLDYLKLTSNFGATSDWFRSYNFTPNRDIWISQNPGAPLSKYLDPYVNTLTQERSSSYRFNWDNFLTFNKNFNEHTVTATAGYSWTSIGYFEVLRGTRNDVPVQSNYWNLDFATFTGTPKAPVNPGNVVNGSEATPTTSLSAFGRVEYDYKDKYLLSASYRREGISSFQKGRRWDGFPSVSAGWVISNEDFMNGVSFLNSLKLRGGYGEVGNGYGSRPLNQLQFRPNANYPFGVDPTINPGSYVPFQVDPNLTWEVMREIDLGIDFTVLDSRLSGTFDVYSRTQDRLILPVKVPSVVSPESVYLNAGEVSNKGFEVSLRWSDNIGEDFRYWIGGNFSYNKNELKSVDNIFFGQLQGGSTNNGELTKQVLVGEALGSFYVYDYSYGNDGYFVYSAQRKVAGSYLPTHTYGANIGFEWKRFDFAADIYGVGGNKIYNGKKALRMGGENVESAILDDFWTPSTPNAENPRPFNDRPRPSTYYIEDGAFLRINNITVGYTLPEMLEGLDKIRVYATAVNPFLFTKYSGYSPELSGNSNGDPLGTAGIELDAYPTNKTFVIGLNVGF